GGEKQESILNLRKTGPDSILEWVSILNEDDQEEVNSLIDFRKKVLEIKKLQEMITSFEDEKKQPFKDSSYQKLIVEKETDLEKVKKLKVEEAINERSKNN